MAAIVFLTVAAFSYLNGRVRRDADQFLQAVLHRRWAEAYLFMSPAERTTLGMSSDQFSRFFTAFSDVAWPSQDHVKIEEMIPYVPTHADVDTSWTPSGTRKFSVSFLRPDNATDLESRIDFRHDLNGEWHPDVFPFIFSIGKSVPHGHPALGLLNGLRAAGMTTLETYPFHQKTSIQELQSVVTTHKGFYLRSAPQPLH